MVRNSFIVIAVENGGPVTAAANAADPNAMPVKDSHGPAVFAGFLGWTLDAFDFFLVVLCLTAIAQEFHRSDKEIALFHHAYARLSSRGGIYFWIAGRPLWAPDCH
jgi:hypothetical protein